MHRSDEEYLPTIKPNSLTHQEKSNKCLVYMLSTIVILSILILVMGLTILRANSPDLKLRQIHARNLRFTTTPFASLEMDVVSEVTIDNTNLFGRFKFHNSSSSVFYGNETLGISDINGGARWGS
ncbi:hypothetical protein Leryth_016163 [Lithospermum erythrorhizon]|nr:hypothetical protein Leryth_016163 [Lithospermum erythrorhizon]